MKNIKNLTSGYFPEIIPDRLNYIYLLLILIITLVSFSPAFFFPEPNQENNFNYPGYHLNGDYYNSFWIDNYDSGLPFYPLTKTPENRIFFNILQHINPSLIWRVIFLFIAATGIFLFMKFIGFSSLLSLLGALFYGLSMRLILGELWQETLVFISLCYLPWFFLTLEYMKERKSILSFSLLALNWIFIIKASVIEIIMVALIWLIYNVIRYFFFGKSKESWIFLLLCISSLILGFFSASYPNFYWIKLLDKIIFRLPFINLSILISTSVLIILATLVPVLCQYLIHHINEDQKDNIHWIRIGIIITLIAVVVVLWMLFMFNNTIPDIRIIALLFFVIIFSIFSLLLINGTVGINFFLFTILLIAIIGLTGLNFYGYNKLLLQKSDISEARCQEVEEFLNQDQDFYRILYLEQDSQYDYWSERFSSVKGHFPYRLKVYDSIVKCCMYHEIQNRVPLNWNILNMLNVKYIISGNKLPFDNLEYAYYAMDSDKIIYKNEGMLPRFWFVKNAEVLETKALVLGRLNDQDFHPQDTAILETGVSNFAKFTSDECHLIQSETEIMVFQTKKESSGFLVLSEIYFPSQYGWKVDIDGKAGSIQPVNGILRGIYIPAGEHEVTLQFQPEGLFLLQKINLATIALVIILMLIGMILYLRENYKGEIIYVLRK